MIGIPEWLKSDHPWEVIEAALAQHEDLFFVLAHVSDRPGLEPPAGAVQELLLPGDRNHLDTPAGPVELVPKVPVGSPAVIKLASGSQVELDKDHPVRLDSHRHLDVEIANAFGNESYFEPSFGEQVSRVSFLSPGPSSRS